MSVIQKLRSVDQNAFDRVAAAELPGLERILPALSKAADHSVLWFAASAALSVQARPRLRRAALRGALAIGVASPLANLVGKRLFRRTRPLVDMVPAIRRRHRIPTSSAFPSGHSASAAAFATGVAMEAPARVALPVAALAGMVAFSRVYTGAHYPGDVAAGIALGTLAGLTTRTFWPALPGPADVMKIGSVESWHREDSGTARGEGLVAVVNTGAGAAPARFLPAAPITRLLADELPEAEIVTAGPDDDLDALLESAAERAKALAVAGGDGTINAAARVALAHGLPLLVIPAGTFNHFARTLGLETPADAIAAYTGGALARVDAGRVELGDGSESLFLNNAALGAYPELVSRRVRLEKRLGKWPAVAVAAAQVLRHAEPVPIMVGGHRRRLWMGFVGNGIYGARGSAPSWRAHLDDGLLDVRLVITGRRVPRLRAFAAMLVGHLHVTGEYRRWKTTGLRIRPVRPQVLVARDGEASWLTGPLRFAKNPLQLVVFVPERPRGLI